MSLGGIKQSPLSEVFVSPDAEYDPKTGIRIKSKADLSSIIYPNRLSDADDLKEKIIYSKYLYSSEKSLNFSSASGILPIIKVPTPEELDQRIREIEQKLKGLEKKAVGTKGKSKQFPY